MSWKLGSKRKFGIHGDSHHLRDRVYTGSNKDASVTPIPSRPTTPMPTDGSNNFRTGMLTIRVCSGEYLDLRKNSRRLANTVSRTGRGMALAPSVQVPEVIKRALASSPPTRKSTSNRESMQRNRYWWLPYVVLEFDKNEILIDALGGDLGNPVWNYRANLFALFCCGRS